MFEFSGYHALLAVLGSAIVLSRWLPRFVSKRDPVALALVIDLRFLAFGLIPGMPEALSTITSASQKEGVGELCVIIGLLGIGFRIDRLRNWHPWRPMIVCRWSPCRSSLFLSHS